MPTIRAWNLCFHLSGSYHLACTLFVAVPVCSPPYDTQHKEHNNCMCLCSTVCLECQVASRVSDGAVVLYLAHLRRCDGCSVCTFPLVTGNYMFSCPKVLTSSCRVWALAGEQWSTLATSIHLRTVVVERLLQCGQACRTDLTAISHRQLQVCQVHLRTGCK